MRETCNRETYLAVEVSLQRLPARKGYFLGGRGGVSGEEHRGQEEHVASTALAEDQGVCGTEAIAQGAGGVKGKHSKVIEHELG